jgi:hypothetical protein
MHSFKEVSIHALRYNGTGREHKMETCNGANTTISYLLSKCKSALGGVKMDMCVISTREFHRTLSKDTRTTAVFKPDLEGCLTNSQWRRH